MKQPRLFIVAAGSGGHMIPALQCARHWLNDNPSGQVFFFTGNSKLEQKITAKEHALAKVIPMALARFSLSRWWQIPLVIFQTGAIFVRGLYYSLVYRPTRVISTGGLLSVPLCAAARLAQRQVEVYELNVVPGKAIKALMPIANIIYTTFPQTKAYCHWGRWNFEQKCREIAYPLRFTNKDKVFVKENVITRINTLFSQQKIAKPFETQRSTLFILGGSQGSVLLNTLIKQLIEHNPGIASNLQVIHQTGSFEESTWNNWYADHHIPALTFSYDQQVQDYYLLSDLIVCRAGAGTMFEIAFFQKTCIVIPLVSSTTDHQIYNAQAMAERYPQLFHVMEQEKIMLDPSIFFTKIHELLSLR